MAFLDSIKFSLDQGLGILAKKGLSPNQVWVFNKYNDQVDFDTARGGATSKLTRITVSDGYAEWIKPDGYMNPPVGEMASTQLILSSGALATAEMWLGPLVLPYTTENGHSGGTPDSIFQPDIDDSFTVEAYVLIKGPVITNPNGAYFTVDRIHTGPMHGMNYYVVLRSAPPAAGA